MKAKKNLYSATVTTGVLTLDHHALLEPELKFGAKDGDLKFYRAMAYWKANDPKNPVGKIIAATDELLKEWGVERAALDTTGIRTGEDKIAKADKPENYEYLKGMLFINPKKAEKNGSPKFFKYDAESKSQISLRTPDEINEHFYRGARVILSVSLGTYELAGKKGITIYLNNIMHVAHGTRIGGASGAEFSGVDADFEVEDDDAAV